MQSNDASTQSCAVPLASIEEKLTSIFLHIYIETDRVLLRGRVREQERDKAEWGNHGQKGELQSCGHKLGGKF
jgi:hypothetical protein